jgi:hypothetical protein
MPEPGESAVDGAPSERWRPEFEDYEEIRRLKARYCRFVDEQQWKGLRDLFTDDCTFEMGVPADSSRFPVPPWTGLRAGSADHFVELVQDRLSSCLTVHQVHAPDIELAKAQEATGVWSLYDEVRQLVYPDRPSFRGHGRYRETYRRTRQGWQFASVRMERIWMERLPFEAFPSSDVGGI